METITFLEDGDEGAAGVEVFAMVDDGGEPVEEVFVDAPLRAERLWDSEDGIDGGTVVGVDIGAPFGVVVVDAVG
jgi:hypothetical protein